MSSQDPDAPQSFVNPDVVIRDARIGADPLQPMADKLGMPDDVAIDLEPHFRGERIDQITDVSDSNFRFAERLVLLTTFPPDVIAHEDLIWSPYRCVFAGFGHGLHKKITELITAKVPHCPWDPDENLKDWYDAGIKARQASGIPLGLIRVPWRVIAAAYPMTDGTAPAFDAFLDHAASVELARYARHRVDDVGRHIFTWIGGPSELGLVLRHPQMPLSVSFVTVPGAFVHALRMRPPSKSKKNPQFHPPSEAMTRLLGSKTIAQIAPMQPVSSLDPLTLQGPWPRRLEGSPTAGLVPVGMTVEGLWDLRVHPTTKAVTMTTTDASIDTVGVDYRPAPLDAKDINAAFGEQVARRSLSLAAVRAPHEHILEAFPNLEPPITDQEAYAAMLDALMTVPFIKGHADRQEFPLVFASPHIPTPEEATDTGKSMLAASLAKVFAPKVTLSKFQGQGAPDARAFCAKIIADGTAAIDEFIAVHIGDQHPLHEANLLSIALGGEITHGQVLSNESHAAKLRFPLFFSAKVVYGQIDLYNRAFLFELSKIKDAKPGVLARLQDGSWSFDLSIDCRLAAHAMTADVRDAFTKLPVSSGGWRYKFTRAAAALMLSRREQIDLHLAAERIDQASVAMIDRLNEQLSKAATSGLTSVSTNSSASQSLKLTHVFDGDLLEEDAFVHLTAQPRLSIKELLNTAAKQRGLDSPSDLFERVFGVMYRASEQQLTRVITANAKKMMPKVGDIWRLTGQRGSEGWALERLADRNGLLSIRLTDKHHVDVPLDTPIDGGSIPPIKDTP